ncbi:hypothetical protein ACFYT3_13525 [Nocardia amikacinitolerans]|uniref:hypothetical protein n=1 Tax=Nocardia amikacinitolerans TaxID=756689 RepID=UPI00369FAA39
MSEFLFLDSAVLGNFVRVGRLDLLESILGGRGRWTSAVEYEVARALPADALVSLNGCMGEPIDIDDPAEIGEVHRLRRVVFGGAETRSLQNLGEAETCFLLTKRSEFAGSRWITDNADVLRYAQRRGIATWQTRELMSEAVLNGEIAPDQARDVLVKMRCQS